MLSFNHKIIYRHILLFLFCLPMVCVSFSFASTGQRTHFLAYGPGVAASAMGETFTSIGNDMSVIYYNPALLVNLNGEEISTSHWFLYDGARYSFVGFSTIMDKSAFALAGTQFYRGNVEVRQTFEDEKGFETSNNQIGLYGAYSGIIDKLKLNYGVSLKWISFKMYTEKSDAVGLDVGLSRQIFMFGNPTGKKLSIDSGLLIQNPIRMDIKMNDVKEELPLTIKLGFAGTKTLFPKYYKNQDRLSYDEVKLATDFILSEQKLSCSFGAEYKIYEKMFLRMGWKNGITAGFGFLLSDFQIDYAFLSKEFTDFHKIGFIYRFGQTEKKENQAAYTFTDEYQKVYQRANRVYTRYYRDASLLAEQNKYEEAAELLKKAIPLKPNENQKSKELLAVYKQLIIAEKTNTHITKAKEEETKRDYINAYKHYLEAFNLNPEDENIQQFLQNIENQVKDTNVKKSINEYVQLIYKKIDILLEKKEFQAVKKEVKKLEFFELGTAITLLSRKINDKKNLYVYKFVSEGYTQLKKENFAEAFLYFLEAEKLNPDDTSISDQKNIAKKKYLGERNFSIEDNLYADKLYYLAAYSFATNESPIATYEELKSFNPLHEYLPVLEEILIERGIIQKKTF